MGARTDRVLVVDVECTCWETKEEQGDRPNELIEIGICELVVKTGEIRDASGYVVKPRFTEVSPFCTELTGWTKEQIAEGSDIADVLKAIAYDYSTDRETVWFSCGEYDRVKLSSDGRAGVGGLYGISRRDNPFALMRSHFNVKTLFALKHKLRKEMAMDRMIQYIGETLDGRHHNGCDDAYNIAKIVRHVLS